MTYNTIYERLVEHNKDVPRIQGYIAYCLYKEAKRQWITERTDTGSRPTETEIQKFSENYVAMTLDAFSKNAEAILVDYSKEVVEKEKPSIIAHALKGSVARDIWLGILVNFLWTIILIAFVVIIQKTGVDIINMLDIHRQSN